jgi:thiamine-phosphate pyrophosphorylase
MGLPDRICFITDRSLFRDLDRIVSLVLDSGIRWIQYREKIAERAFIFEEAMRLKEITHRYNAFLTINDHPDIAVAVDAEGLHLGQEDLPIKEARRVAGKRIIGVSTHSISEAVNAEREGADYIGFGPIFMTSTKDAGPPKGLDMLREIKKNVKIPVVAIGGIKAENLAYVFEAGADAVAVASGLIMGDIEKNIETFMRIAESTLEPIDFSGI